MLDKDIENSANSHNYRGKDQNLMKFEKGNINECMSIQELKTKATMSKSNENNNDNKTELLIENEELPEIKHKEELSEVEIKMIKHLNKEAIRHKSRGNLLFKEGKYELALNEYKKTVDLLSLNEEFLRIASITNINYLINECLINVSVCYLVLKRYNNVLDVTKQILSSHLATNRLKCYIIRCKAFQGLSMYGEAVDCLKHALSIKPTNVLLKELEKIESKFIPKSSNIESNTNKSNVNCYKSKNIFMKIIRIIFAHLKNFLGNNKFICFILGVIVLIELKNGISSIFSKKMQTLNFMHKIK